MKIFKAFALLLAFSLNAHAKEVDFNREVRPILSDKCFFCHGPDKEHRKAKLRLDLESSVKDQKKKYIIPGKPQDSELIYRLTTDDEDDLMPPPDSGKSLSPQEKKLISQWIAEGARWSEHWAYVQPKKHDLPEVKKSDRVGNWIDRFTLKHFEDNARGPATPADSVTLVRRLHFDLIGLRPEPEVVETFARDPSEEAYEALVERLLASEHHGEKMASYWLDLVRFADTVGYHGDQDHSITPYRDWVIDSFNDGLPFDQFTREQLAGDLLPSPTIDQTIATGYNRLLQTSHEGGVQKKEYIAMYAADRVRNLSEVWMGATMGCAQCHDHKYDPYTAKDFYSMAAFFDDIDDTAHLKNGSNSLPTRRDPEINVLSRRQRDRIATLEKTIDARETIQKETPESKVQAEIKALKSEVDAIKKVTRKTMITRVTKPRVTHILPRGDWLDESGPVVQSAIPEFMGSLASEKRLTRLDLANWLMDADKGAGKLTARVLANRLWYLLFGQGLAPDLTDFGGQGQPPEHPELLDNLSISLIEKNWRIKALLKEIVLSRTYRQTSSNSGKKISFQTSYRLPAETIRDNALAISGLLVREVGGASIKPYQPAGYYRHLNFPTRKYDHHKDERQWRRGVYVHWQRQFLHPMMKAFDAPRREECTAQRPNSNTPLAALVLLNDPTFVEAAQSFAKRILDEEGTAIDSRLDFAFREAVSRKPDAFERNILKKLLTSQKTTEDAAWTTVARGILNLAETNLRR
ncbi:PSD1 and planctomycete cytochrome C domain-containing protein [Opitutales bacterium]|nr:PSD1 and planctomycete cytochrome C domain-containing protein [Opitutales bacterium]